MFHGLHLEVGTGGRKRLQAFNVPVRTLVEFEGD